MKVLSQPLLRVLLLRITFWAAMNGRREKKPGSMVRMCCHVQTILQEKPASEAWRKTKPMRERWLQEAWRYCPVPRRRCGGWAQG
ncbi:hypothetical protein PSNIH2_09340 [Pantoea sp. PSNIH2]|nr:hypothetical protein PSNIH2_09340 [Pantoea sp. PSNIH2]